jgi:hypothetical protein
MWWQADMMHHICTEKTDLATIKADLAATAKQGLAATWLQLPGKLCCDQGKLGCNGIP